MKLLMLMLALAHTLVTVAQTPEQNIEKLKIKLPPAGAPVASYVNAVRTGNLVFLAGKGPKKDNGEYITGRLGENLTIEQGYEAARLTAVNQIAVLKDLLGDLGKIRRIVKANGYVNSTADFHDQPKVINGYSDLMIQVFGDKGKHARTSLSVNALPFNMAVEIEMVVEVE